MPPYPFEEHRDLNGRFVSSKKITPRPSMPPSVNKEHKDLNGRLEFFTMSRTDGTAIKVLAVGVATDDDLAHIAQEEQDPSFAECVVVAALEHNRVGRKRINYLWKLGESYQRASYESVSRWYLGLWEEQIATKGTAITTHKLGRSTRILNIFEGHETLEQARTSKLDAHWADTRQAAHRKSTIQAAERESSQAPNDKEDQIPRQVPERHAKLKIRMRAVPATDDQDDEISGDDMRAPRPRRSAGAPKRFIDDDSFEGEEDSSCEQRLKRPRKIIKLPVKQTRTSMSPGRRTSLDAVIPSTTQASAGAATSVQRWPSGMTAEAKTALLDVVRSTPQIKAEQGAAAGTTPDPTNSIHSQQRITISAPNQTSSASSQMLRQTPTAGTSITVATTPIMPQDTKQTNGTPRKEALKVLTEASGGLCDPEAVQLAVQTLTGKKPPLSIIQRATFARVVTRDVESIYDFHAYRQWFRDNEVSMMADDSGAEAM